MKYPYEHAELEIGWYLMEQDVVCDSGSVYDPNDPDNDFTDVEGVW